MKTLNIWLLLLVVTQGLYAQNIYIDKPVLAEKLTCFPEISNPNNYYFLPNKLRLGMDENKNPQFSFLMFVRNTRAEDGEATPREGEGGGVVHAVVELYIDDEEKKDAERALRKLVKNDAATIIGPVIYKSGTMSLVSSVADPAGGYSKVVLGLGPAPVLAGNKAATSILLNKEGAKILWETFKTPTPDMSFSFVMDVEGYRSPISAWIDVNFDKVYESQTIEAGLKYRPSANQNSSGGQGGRQNGGTTNPANGGTTNPANGGTTNPANGGTANPANGGTTNPANGGTANPANGGTTNPANGGTANPANGGTTNPANGGTANPANGGTANPANGGTANPANGGTANPANGGTANPANGGTANPANGGNTRPANGGTPKPASTPEPASRPNGTNKPVSPGGRQLSSIETELYPTNGPVLLTSASLMAFNPFMAQLLEQYPNLTIPEDYEAVMLDDCGEVNTFVVEDAGTGTPIYLDAEIKLMFEEMRQTGAIKVGGPEGDEKFEEIIKICYNKMLDMLFEPSGNGQASTPDMNSMLGAANQINQRSPAQDTGFNNGGGFSISFGYKFKKVKKTGSFRMDLNRSMTDALKIRFDENLGKINCKTCFRQINLDDPMFRQRAVLVSVDGMNAEQFKKYVNYVAISMKKTHGNAEITSDEVRIAMADIERTGNLFRLQYGWKDEKDAQKDQWLKYEYKTTWSFFGNQTIETPWTGTDNFTINAAPPLRPFTVDVEASSDLLKQQEVRSVNVRVYYNTGTGERMEQLNIRADAPSTAAKLEFVLPEGKYDYDYEIIWRLTGNREVKIPRTKSNSTFLYADELPK